MIKINWKLGNIETRLTRADSTAFISIVDNDILKTDKLIECQSVIDERLFKFVKRTGKYFLDVRENKQGKTRFTSN